MATKCRPAALPSASTIRAQKNRSSEATSTVPPLLLETRNSVRAGSRRDASCGDCPLVGRVEHVELGMPAGDAADHPQHLRAQAAAAHAEQIDGVEAFGSDLLSQMRGTGDLRGHRRGNVEPAETGPNRSLVGAARRCAPGARIPIPDSRDEAFVQEAIDEAGSRGIGERHHLASYHP